MKFKLYNKRILLTFSGFLVFLGFFNYIINPFDVFNVAKIKKINYIKPDISRNQRITKIISLKLDKEPLDAVFLGSSRVNSSISEEYCRKLTGKNAKNLGMNALSHDETFKVARNAVLIHPEIKTIYFGLDFFRFLERNKDNKRDVTLSNSPNLSISELNPLILSFNATIASFNTLFANLTDKKQKKEKSKKEYFSEKLAQYSNNYRNAVLVPEEAEKLQLFKNEMNKRGYNVVFYTNPTHACDIALIDKMEYLNLFNEWKVLLANNFEYTDFDFINELTSEKINSDTKYFIESSHASLDFGEIILKNLLDKPDDFSLRITKDNVENHNLANMGKLKKWEADNPEFMKELEVITDEEQF